MSSILETLDSCGTVEPGAAAAGLAGDCDVAGDGPVSLGSHTVPPSVGDTGVRPVSCSFSLSSHILLPRLD